MAILIDTDAEYVAVADNAKFDFTPVDDTMTLCLYWKSTSVPDADGEYQVLYQLNDTSGNKLQFLLYNSSGTNYLACFVRDVAYGLVGYYLCAAPAITSDTWYHIAFVCSTDENCKIYWNASAQSVSHTTWSDTDTLIAPDTIVFGGNGVNIDDNMTIAHVQVFSDELSSGEISSLMNAPWTFDTDANNIASWHCTEMQGTTAEDTGNATQTDGTLTGGPTWAAGPVLGIIPKVMHHLMRH